MHSDFFGYPLGGPVIRMDDCYELAGLSLFFREIEAGCGCLRCKALALQIGSYVVSDLKLPCSIHRLPGQTTVADECSVMCLDHPYPYSA